MHYNYDPANPLPHGGGTDAISIYRRQILISASAPSTTTAPATRPAVYRVVLSQTAGGGTARLSPFFYGGSAATVANTTAPKYTSLSPSPSSYGRVAAQGMVTALPLIDPDSNEVVPSTSPRFAGDFVLDSQGDEQLVFAAGSRAPKPSVLDLSQSINDSAYLTGAHGTLYLTDPAADQVLAVHGPFRPGQVLVAATPGSANNAGKAPNYVASLNLSNGTVTPVAGLDGIEPQGLLCVASSADEAGGGGKPARGEHAGQITEPESASQSAEHAPG